MICRLKLLCLSPSPILFAVLFFTACLCCASDNAPVQSDSKNPSNTSSRRIVRVGYYPFPGFHMINADGKKSGYGYEFFQYLQPYTPWKLVFSAVEHEWPEMLPLLEAGKIDMVSGVEKTPERQEKFAFSKYPVGIFSTVMTISGTDGKYKSGDYRNWNGIRIGMLRGSERNEGFKKFAEGKGFSFVPVMYDSVAEMLDDLRMHRKIDAAVSSNLREIKDETVIEKFGVTPFYIVVRQADRELLAELNQAMEVLEKLMPQLSSDLWLRYYVKPGTKELILTPEEKEFIRQANAGGRRFVILLNPDRYPLSYIENGEIRGILKEIADEAIRRSGLPVEFRPVKTRVEYFAASEEPGNDIIFDMMHDFQKAELLNIVLSRPYYTGSVSMLRNKDSLEKINSVALVDRSDIFDAVRKYLPATTRVEVCPSYPDAISSVESGRSDAAFMYTLTAEKAITQDIHNVLTLDNMSMFDSNFAVGVRETCDPLLAAILNKAVASIDSEFINQVRTKYLQERRPVYSLSGLVHLYPWLFLGGGAVLVLLMSFLLCHIVFSRKISYRLGGLLARLPFHCFVISRDGRFLYYNFGITKRFEKIKLNSVDKIPDEEVRSLMRKKIASVLDTGKTEMAEFEFEKRARSVSVYKLPDSMFGCETVLWISQDITELRESREEARKNEEFCRLTLNSVGDGILTTDVNGRVLMLNPVAEHMIGIRQADAVGRPHDQIFRIMSSGDHIGMESPIIRTLRTGTTVELANHTELVSLDGKRHYHIADSSAPIHDAKGEIVGAILVFRDVSEEYRRRAEIQTEVAHWEAVSTMAKVYHFRYNPRTHEISGSKRLSDVWPVRNGAAVPAADWVHPDDVAAWQQANTNVLSGKRPEATFQYRVRQDEKTRYFRVFMRKAEDSSDEITGLIQDITRMVQEQKSKENMRSMWQAVVDSVPVLLFVKDVEDEFRYLSANRNVAGMFNLSVDEMIGLRVQDVFADPEEARQIIENDKEVMNSGKSCEMYETLHDSKGELHHFKTVKIPSVNGDGRKILIQMTLDITELQELSEVRKIVTYAFEQVFSSDQLEAGIQAILKRVCEFIGFSRGYVCCIDEKSNSIRIFTSCILNGEESLFCGETFRIEDARNLPWYRNMMKSKQNETFDCDFSNEHDRERAKLHCPGVLEKQQAFDLSGIHINYISVDGKPWGNVGFITQHASVKKLTLNEKRLLEMTAHIIELAISRRQTMGKLEIALRDAQAADKAKSFFLASMSHEIRTPLNAVIGFSELMKDSALDHDTQQEYVSGISLAGNALLQLINDILDLSKLEAGQVEYVQEKTDFAAFSRELAAVFQNGANQKNLRLTFETDGIPDIYIDRQRMRQILFNLIGNAIKFTQRGGITVSAGFEKNSGESGTLTLKVADTGIGIAPEDRKKLFQPFVQLSRMRGTNANNNGTGLGLSIVLKMLKQMGGKIELESESGKGSTFVITLPEVKFEASAEIPSESLPHGITQPGLCPPDENPKILLVDDTALNLKILGSMLKHLHIAYVCAHSGKEALEMLKVEHFNIVLTDLLMPEMSGEDLAKAIRSNPDYAKIKIGVVTAEGDRTQYESTLFDQVLPKPVMRDELFKYIYGR